MDSGRVEIRFGGERYGNWQQVEIRESVDDLCASLRLAIALPGTGAGAALTLDANSVVEVLIDDDLVTTVRVDALRRALDADSHSIFIEARSLARELVDCQYSKTLSGLKLAEVVKAICTTFKVPVKVDAQTAVVPDFSMQCEVPANALINAARAANLLFYPLADGGLLLTSPTSAAPVATLEYGVNLKAYELVDEYKLRFSDYVIKGYDYASNAALKGAVKDSGIAFFRPMYIVADRAGQGLGGCDRRANLERNRRLARAHRLEVTVQGWRYQNDDAWRLWAINTQVRVIIPDEGIDGVFLVGERAFRRDARGGTLTQLTLMHRDAFAGEEPNRKAKRGTGVKGVRR